MKKRKRFALGGLTLVIIILVLGDLRVFSVAGASEAPTYVLNDRVVVNKVAYGLTVPYTDRCLFRWGEPARGDMVLLRLPDREDEHAAMKRVLGVPGDTIEIQQNQVWVNDEAHAYHRLEPEQYAWVPEENGLGEVIAIEVGADYRHTITFSPGGECSSFGPVTLAEDEYFVLGDNRDLSLDSRHFGPVRACNILGEVLGTLTGGPPS